MSDQGDFLLSIEAMVGHIAGSEKLGIGLVRPAEPCGAARREEASIEGLADGLRCDLHNLPVFLLGPPQGFLDREVSVHRVDKVSLRDCRATGEESHRSEAPRNCQPLIGTELACLACRDAAGIALCAEPATALQVNIFDLAGETAITPKSLEEEAESQGLDRKGHCLA